MGLNEGCSFGQGRGEGAGGAATASELLSGPSIRPSDRRPEPECRARGGDLQLTPKVTPLSLNLGRESSRFIKMNLKRAALTAA